MPKNYRQPGLSPLIWRNLLDSGIRTFKNLPLALNPDDTRWEPVIAAFPMRINAYFLSLIGSADDPLGRQVIPDMAELADLGCSEDPLGEEAQSPVPQVIHRYPHRVAFQVSNQCAVYCRFCMRKRRVGTASQVTEAHIDCGLNYIRSQSQINEVVLTGGDPLMLADDRLLAILRALHAIPHVRWLRIHTRMPSVLPQRITPELAKGLARFHPLFINIHFNHPTEITAQAASACRLLADAGIPLGSQTVLLRGVNDDPLVLSELMQKLLAIRVRPYYLHQLDRVAGTAHFRVPIQKSLELLGSLRGPVSGMGIPHLMVDLPAGGGKVALAADAVAHKGEKLWQVRNWQGDLFSYPVE